MTIAEDPRPTPDFPITWEEPSDPEVSWEWDDMHMPFALAPLAADYVRVLGLGFNQCYELFGDFPQRWHCRVWNGYAFFGHQRNVPDSDWEALSARWLQVMRARADVTEAYWTDEVLPEIKSIDARIRAFPVESLGAAELAAAWDEAWQLIGRLWQIHFNVILGPYTILEELADVYEALVTGAAPGESLRLIQGVRHELFAAESGMERLAESGAAKPAIRELLVEATCGAEGQHRAVGVDEIAVLDGGPAFLDELDDFLDEHGHMGQPFDDLSMASWAEDPAIVLGELGRRLAHPPEPAEARRLRLAADADALADAVRARLAGQPDELERFEALLTLSRAIGPLTEVHNYWIDRLAQARLRAFSMRVGARLAGQGCFEVAPDILYLHRDEVRELIERPVDVRALVAERRSEHERQRTSAPPRQVGAPPARSGESDRFDGQRFTSEEADVLLGTGASPGTARGPARVTLGPADFGRIRSGDVIVCPSSNPSWVPVFTLAAGLVTNTGGILSHAAVVAREFGLPAVVGTGDATTRIRDGQLVEIDGSTGRVRLL